MRTTREGAFPFTDGPRRVLAVRAAGEGHFRGRPRVPVQAGGDPVDLLAGQAGEEAADDLAGYGPEALAEFVLDLELRRVTRLGRFRSTARFRDVS
jgi:hypothetical protein